MGESRMQVTLWLVLLTSVQALKLNKYDWGVPAGVGSKITPVLYGGENSDSACVARWDGTMVFVSASNPEPLFSIILDDERIVAEPVICKNNFLFVGTVQGNLHAYFLLQSSPVLPYSLEWIFPADGAIEKAVVVTNDCQHIIFASFSGHVYKMTAKEGILLWRFEVAPSTISTRPVSNFDGSLVFVAADNGCIYTIDGSKGVEQSKYCTDIYINDIVNDEKNEKLYAVSSQGRLLALRSDKSEVVWDRTDVADGILHCIMSTRNDILYVISFDATLYALDTVDGSQQWHLPIEKSSNHILSKPRISPSGNALFLKSSAQILYSISLLQKNISCAVTVGEITELPFEPVSPIVFNAWNDSKPVVIYKNHNSMFDLAPLPSACIWN